MGRKNEIQPPKRLIKPQLVENRFDKLMERGGNYMSSKSYNRAIEMYQEAYKINQKDFSLLANLTEAYLITRNYFSFEEKLSVLMDNMLEDREKITSFYLKTTYELLKEHNFEAREELNKFIQFIVDNPRALEHFLWDFEDIKNADPYRCLNGESKKMLENMIRYLEKSLDGGDKKLFEDKNYLLQKSS
jgi:tetratricopeptide (TPR) repeat protein